MGNPVTRYDIDFDEEILKLYALMPESYFDFLQLLETNIAAAILSLPLKELTDRNFAYALLSPADQRDIFWREDLVWLIEPSCQNQTAGIAG